MAVVNAVGLRVVVNPNVEGDGVRAGVGGVKGQCGTVVPVPSLAVPRRPMDVGPFGGLKDHAVSVGRDRDQRRITGRSPEIRRAGRLGHRAGSHQQQGGADGGTQGKVLRHGKLHSFNQGTSTNSTSSTYAFGRCPAELAERLNLRTAPVAPGGAV